MSRNPTRRSDPVYAQQSAESHAGARSAFVAGESATFSMDALKSPDKGGTSPNIAAINGLALDEAAANLRMARCHNESDHDFRNRIADSVRAGNATLADHKHGGKGEGESRTLPRANDAAACGEVGQMSIEERIFVADAMRLAAGPHPYAAASMLARAIIMLQRHAHEPQDIDARVELALQKFGLITITGVPVDVLTITGVDLPNSDPRKPWVEPTVTELPRGPVSPPTPGAILKAIGWLRSRADLQPVRAAEFEVVAKIVEGMRIEIQRSAGELAEVQGMLEEAAPLARFVADIAKMTDLDCDNTSSKALRQIARDNGVLARADFPFPKFYDDDDRARAISLLAQAYTNGHTIEESVDLVAEALGLTRAGQ